MMSEQYDWLFWTAVAVLVIRAGREFSWACLGVVRLGRHALHFLRRALPALRTHLGLRPGHAPAPTPIPGTNYLETMSPEEMDQLLSPQP